MDDEPPDRAVREPSSRRHVLGRQAGHGVHRRGDPGASSQTGQYSKEAEEWITADAHRTAQSDRPDVSLRACCRSTASAIEHDALAFDDLGVTYGFARRARYTVEWSRLRQREGRCCLGIGTGPRSRPQARGARRRRLHGGAHHAGDAAMKVDGVSPQAADGFDVVGIDRHVAGQGHRDAAAAAAGRWRAYRRSVDPQQQALFETYVDGLQRARGSRYTAEEGFDRLTVSRADDVLRQ